MTAMGTIGNIIFGGFVFLSLYRNLYIGLTSHVSELPTDLPLLKRQHQPRFAYAFVVAGCTRESCLGYLLNAIVASCILQSYNSTADIVFKVQMAFGGANELRKDHEAWLKAAGVVLEYIPSSRTTNFGLAELQKFRVLQLTRYDRVMFLDADNIPLCNMDYMFYESYNSHGVLEDQVGIAGGVAPATGSMFLVTPAENEFETIMDLVRQYRNRHKNSTAFDVDHGWGHEIEPPDRWRSWHSGRNKVNNRSEGLKWDFYGAHAGQGLLYHWLKYVKLSYSQIHLKPATLETWKDVTLVDKLALKNTSIHKVGDKRLAQVREEPLAHLKGCGGANVIHHSMVSVNAPYSDHLHFQGSAKPWNQPIHEATIPVTLAKKPKKQEVWLYYLGKANKTFNLQLPSMIQVTQGNPLGTAPQENHITDPNADLPEP